MSKEKELIEEVMVHSITDRDIVAPLQNAQDRISAFTDNKRLKVLLRSAIDLLRVDGDDYSAWCEYIYASLGTDVEELKKFGIEL